MIASDKLYPMKFAPIFLDRIWGGDMITQVLGRQVPHAVHKVGELWEISDRPEADSIIANGPLAGDSLHNIATYYGADLLGRKCREKRFPLLVKILDCGSKLSLQVHPGEEFCRRHDPTAEPKAEMWYILAHTPKAEVMAGLNSKATKQQFLDTLHSVEVEKIMQRYDSRTGDAYFIPAGTLHAIGGGNLILEIQQNSDTTYRASDWGRIDINGKPRRLDEEKAIQAADFTSRVSTRIPMARGQGNFNRKLPLINRCPAFNVELIAIASTWREDTVPDESFHLLSAINCPLAVTLEADANCITPEQLKIRIEIGETALIPANYGVYYVNPLTGADNSEECRFLKTTL